MARVDVTWTWLAAPEQLDAGLARQLLDCWRDVSNAGGAVGFPYLPVSDADVGPAVERLRASLDAQRRVLIGTVDGRLAAWLVMTGSTWRATAHWACLTRVQTALPFRGAGLGRALLDEAARSARDDLGLQSLRLDLRSGTGVERFYTACGYEQVGVWPRALRLPERADGSEDYRDEVLMLLRLS